MSAVMMDLMFATIVAVLGIAGGWFLRSVLVRRDPETNGREIRRSQKILARLRELAAGVAADVGEHSSRVEKINEELTSTDIRESETVMSAVNELIQVNGRMQQRLVSAEEKLQEQARQIESHAAEARTDALTGLANRRAFDDEMVRVFAEFQRFRKTFCVTMIDVDFFKKFNDTYGHQAGDQVLRGVAGVLSQTARETEVVARYGGEEFALIHPDITLIDAGARSDRARKLVDSTGFDFAGTHLHVTLSMGVAEVFPDEAPAVLIERADAALYAAKKMGRNCTYRHDGKEVGPVSSAETFAAPAEGAQGVEPEPDYPSYPGQTASEATRTTPPNSDEVSISLPPSLSDRTAFLTVLGNRLAEWRRDGDPLSVLLVQVNDLADIVADHGPSTGELVRNAIAQFLDAATREMDLSAHYNETTFAMIFPGAGRVRTIGVAERLREAIAQCSLPKGDGNIRFAISLGGTEAAAGDDCQRFLRRAEEALEAANKSGGNCSYFHNGQWSETAIATLEKMM